MVFKISFLEMASLWGRTKVGVGNQISSGEEDQAGQNPCSSPVWALGGEWGSGREEAGMIDKANNKWTKGTDRLYLEPVREVWARGSSASRPGC